MHCPYDDDNDDDNDGELNKYVPTRLPNNNILTIIITY